MYRKIISNELLGKVALFVVIFICLSFLSLNLFAGILAVVAVWVASFIFFVRTFKADQNERALVERALINSGLFTWGWLLNAPLVVDDVQRPRSRETKRTLMRACIFSSILYVLTAIAIFIFGMLDINDFTGKSLLVVVGPLGFLLVLYSANLIALIYKE